MSQRLTCFTTYLSVKPEADIDHFQGHYDSRNSNVNDTLGDAPGADDE